MLTLSLHDERTLNNVSELMGQTTTSGEVLQKQGSIASPEEEAGEERAVQILSEQDEVFICTLWLLHEMGRARQGVAGPL